MERHFASVESVLGRACEILTGEEYRDFIEPYLSREYLWAEVPPDSETFAVSVQSSNLSDFPN